ncbi:pentatricopeptide repeat-containing protein At5g50990 [Andrographis paniculata]|uniref:pentatricopeptide repeat-containing protein At5g50990 n=1 Tax=Andrographis paniculata TaxID=175694 RepID=UPI0021E946C3|nr:pentatricopeptide repeat-containing protein At5g50990 [Andrographis paniculata]
MVKIGSEYTRWRLFCLGTSIRLFQTTISAPKRHCIVASQQTICAVSDDRTLSNLPELCKGTRNFRTSGMVHGEIIKHGYEVHPLLPMLTKVYIAYDKPELAVQLLGKTFFGNFDLVSANLLIANFMKIGKTDIAKKIFSALPARDVVTWNSMIGGCVKNRFYLDAIGMFKEMLAAAVKPDGFTFASVITACSRLGALDLGEWVHGLMTEQKVEMNYILSSALVDMYSRCGRIEAAKSIFDSVERMDISIWNTIINGFAMHGLAADAIATFNAMERENISPDHVTFVGILTACSHCGFIEEGQKYFNLMKNHYLIQPQLEHYGVMIDLFARAGLLKEAFATIQEMPMEPDVVIWRALLSACRIHKNSELGEVVVSKIKHLGSEDYVLLSNIYCSTRKWDNAEAVRHGMSKNGVHKSIGKSWVELNGAIHYFKAGDRSHPEIGSIYRILEALMHRTKMEGYISSGDMVLMDILEEEKEENLIYHSEKLALAFGILKSSPGTEILISKNLRTCYDCHSWIKIVSKVLHRVITVRDRVRFHRFESGSCTCGDYW